MSDPYALLGLRGNPFVAEQAPGVADGLWVERGFSTPPAARSRLFVQVIGPRGAGKTALLLHWRAQSGGPYRYVPQGPGRWRLPPDAPLAFWDEADRLPGALLALALWRAARRRSTVVVGTHRDLGRAAARAGLAVRTVRHPPLDVPTLQRWAALRIEAARLPDAPLRLAADHAPLAEIARVAGPSWRVAADLLHIWAAERAADAALAAVV